ncbi:TlpA family protein disulfide reductase [Rubripirellula amarantea]|nr:TlpA family protein disulfide reductase [Rubripirellula amarantea]
MKKRLSLAALIAAALCVGGLRSSQATAAGPTLTIGSEAPELDIENWMQDGNGFFKPVTEFKKDNVYVVEFWATWCGPCIGSMPHLAELQNQYRGQGVQIISVTNEDTETVNGLLKKQHPQEGKTFEEITSAWCLTSDPDESVSEDYMTASGANGIPTAFVVGKTGLIEWIGHPGSMDLPLEAIVNDAWDRAKFKVQYEYENKMEEAMQRLNTLVGTEKVDEAMDFVTEMIKEAPSQEYKDHWTNMFHNVKLVTGQLDKETTEFYQGLLAQMEENKDPQAALGFANMLFGVSQQGADLGTLPTDTLATVTALEPTIPESYKVLYYNTIALMNELNEDFVKAAEAQEKAVGLATARQAKRMQPYLDELRKKAGIEEDADEEDAGEDNDKDAGEKAADDQE